MTGRIRIDLFVTLDGVAQSPGGRTEDPSGGFRFGGWQAPLDDDEVGQDIMAGIDALDALVLGRRTYDIFAAYWPNHAGPASAVARKFNSVPKYVASRNTPDLEWAGSTMIGDDLHAEIAAIRARHRDIHVIGSVDFAQTLLAERLYDELHLWVYPIVLGQGKKVFPDGAAPANMRLLAPAVTTPTGVLILRYGPGEEGDPTTGEM